MATRFQLGGWKGSRNSKALDGDSKQKSVVKQSHVKASFRLRCHIGPGVWSFLIKSTLVWFCLIQKTSYDDNRGRVGKGICTYLKLYKKLLLKRKRTKQLLWIGEVLQVFFPVPCSMSFLLTKRTVACCWTHRAQYCQTYTRISLSQL